MVFCPREDNYGRAFDEEALIKWAKTGDIDPDSDWHRWSTKLMERAKYLFRPGHREAFDTQMKNVKEYYKVDDEWNPLG